MTTSDKVQEAQQAIDLILQRIIDEWYDNVSSYYVTREQIEAADSSQAGAQEELKRFHDEKGHRIKFAKEALDFTYGLRCEADGENFTIEISVNNKVKDFDYDDFQARLIQHYRRGRQEQITSPYELRNSSYGDVFEFRPNLRKAFQVEKISGKADIMRLTFWIESRFLDKIASHPVAGKQLVEHYCISPFRSVYAKVYRRSH